MAVPTPGMRISAQQEDARTSADQKKSNAHMVYLRESYWGQKKWRGAEAVTFLDVNTRSDRALAVFLDQMRSCRVTQGSYGVLQSRVVGAGCAGDGRASSTPDPRFQREPFNDPSAPPLHIVSRHTASVALAYQNCLLQAERFSRPLYLIFAQDSLAGAYDDSQTSVLKDELLCKTISPKQGTCPAAYLST